MTEAPSIAVVVSGFPRRSETFAVNELLALDERGMLAGIFATKPGDDDVLQPGSDQLVRQLEVLPAGTPGQQGEVLAARLAARGVSGVHAYFAHTPAEVAEHAARRLAIPFGFSVHAKDARKIDRASLAGRARRAACVVACNTDVAGELHGAGRTHLVPHGVDLDRFSVSPAPGGQPLRLLAVGRLVEKKGFSVLVEALAQLDHSYVLRIVGEGPERPRLARRIAEANLSDRVVLVGPRTHAELPAEYAAADVVVVPSVVDAAGDRDGLPNVVLEAMASGRPVVATRVGAIESAVSHDVTGWLVPGGMPHALAAALWALAERPQVRAAMGRRGRQVAERHYGVPQCARRFCDVLEAAYA